MLSFIVAAAAYSPSTLRPATSRASTISAQVSPVLPQLYVYDHCPFCVRVRFALGETGNCLSPCCCL